MENKLRYRPEIDGLRALAVVPVILYHAGVSWIPGGFIGVDVFFVISGYLISTILINEMAEGTFSIVGFYERRARRILPALFLVMLVCIPFAYNYLLPEDIKSFWKSIVSVCFFISNYFFAFETGYFSPNVELKPLLHTWSLAVEEQFYLLFPLILLVLWGTGKRVMYALLFMIFISSLAWSDRGAIIDPILNFYSLTTRSWELLIGVFAAFYLRSNSKYHKNKLISNLLSFFGLILILFSCVYLNKTTPFPGRYALIPTLGAFLIIVFSNGNNVTERLLSLKPVVFIGTISYSMYLWHQPLMSFARHKFVIEPPASLMWIISFATIPLAWLTWKYVETPFRTKGNFSRKTIFKFSLAGSVFFLLLGMIGSSTGYLSRFNDNPMYDKLVYRLRGNYGLAEQCEKKFFYSKNCMTSDEPEVLLWGDSYAMHLAGMFTASNPEIRMIQATISQCAPVIGVSYANAIYGTRDCIEANDRTLDLLKTMPSIKYVVLASPFERFGDNGAIVLRNGTIINRGADVFIQSFKNTIDKIKSLGKIPVVIAPPIKYELNDVGFCLMKSSLLGMSLERCDFNFDNMPEVQVKLYNVLRDISKTTKVIWLSDLTCKNGRCKASENGVFFYRDKGHLPYEGSSYLGRKYDIYKLLKE
ncbi:hypothetical protein CIG19_07155 [Enterobacterales bacterium CwR94]|nr:hypothetical protein CIG19_07155 [Enterobacterales bacterium CwR94]